MLKRVFSLILAFVISLLCLFTVGCKEETEQSQQAQETVSEDKSFYGLELPDDLDYGGRAVNVLTTATAQSPTSFHIQPNDNDMYTAETASSVISTAAECTRLVEQRLGVEIHEEVVYTWSRYGGDMYKKIRSDAMSYTADYIFTMPCSIEAGMLSIDGLLYDLNEVPHIDLNREWWCKQFNDGVTVGGKTYFAIGDIGTVSKEATFFVAFNKKMAESNALAQRYGYSSLYEMVDNKAWTQDVMYEMAKSVYQDTNENNKCDVGDVNGIAGQDGAIYNMLTSAGAKIISVDSSGYPKLSVYKERTLNIIGDAQDYFQDPKSGFISANDYFNLSQVPVAEVIVPEFKADRLLFFMDAIMNLNLIRDMESDFGVLPAPLYDKSQESYSSQIGCWSTNCIAIPTFVSGEDLELAGYIIEALSAVSNKKLNPVYYEQTLQYQISRDDESMRMLDIIFAGRTCELAEIYNLDIFNTVCGMLKAKPDTFASAYEAVKDKTQKRLDEIVDAYKGS